MTESKPTRIAMIGCGAVAENFHLPCLADADGLEVTLLADTNVDRARQLAEKFDVCRTAGQLSKNDFSAFDAAVVAVPHRFHADLCTTLLRQNKHVLVEKPMAITSLDCETMISAERESEATLTIGQMRRYCPAVAFAKACVERGVIGELQGFDIRDGVVFAWPVASDFQFRREAAGGGVLFDNGAHTVDMAVWIFEQLDVNAYRDDAYGGVEADCEIELSTGDGVAGRIELSRTRNLRNSMILSGSEGELEVFFYDDRVVWRGFEQRLGIPQVVRHDRDAVAERSIWPLMFRLQCDAWLRTIRDGDPPPVGSHEGKRVVDLIQRCYAVREPLELPWVAGTAEAVAR